MKQSFLIIVLLVLEVGLFAQTVTLDSLKLALKEAPNDTARCNILDRMIEEENDDEIWPMYNDQMHEIAERGIKTSNDSSLLKFYKIKLGLSYINKGYLEQNIKENSIAAIENYNKAIEILKLLKYLKV
jgi:hypothetical protein